MFLIAYCGRLLVVVVYHGRVKLIIPKFFSHQSNGEIIENIEDSPTQFILKYKFLHNGRPVSDRSHQAITL
ncbi:CLUMA_CG014802, isoform A [Clunio marinus]|uniref:CLUMA_CG014802, isoform A n=1 Tax=Clunio marinus TaxID=568069 RepID=A0A1J1IMX2_9DIPT|nr:CLUMA_CG014802, isoform A [Clunio marinus]